MTCCSRGCPKWLVLHLAWLPCLPGHCLPAQRSRQAPATTSTRSLHAAANARPVGQVLPHAGSPRPFLPSLEDINASPVPLGELLPLLPELLLSGRRFLDRAMASFHESTTPNELAWALQVLSCAPWVLISMAAVADAQADLLLVAMQEPSA